MGLGPFELHARDLAPGDRGALEACWDDFSIESVRDPSGSGFEQGFGKLWNEFGPRGEMERREVIADRLGWRPATPIGGYAFLYEMLVVRRGSEVVAVRDHTAIVSPKARAEWPGSAVVVHLSHVLVEPALRGSGLASWMRALPVDAARRCRARVRGANLELRSGEWENEVTLVAEMECDDGSAESARRLRSYAKAGFRVADPAAVHYSQPDFRAAADIDRSGVRPVPLCLVLRRVRREDAAAIPGRELREIVSALHAMFGVHVRSDHMAPVRELAARLPADGERVALLVPGLREKAGRKESR
jgi:GNAT superfamily N-acetyltransferase